MGRVISLAPPLYLLWFLIDESAEWAGVQAGLCRFLLSITPMKLTCFNRAPLFGQLHAWGRDARHLRWSR